jgi:hypothetical protein
MATNQSDPGYANADDLQHCHASHEKSCKFKEIGSIKVASKMWNPRKEL